MMGTRDKHQARYWGEGGENCAMSTLTTWTLVKQRSPSMSVEANFAQCSKSNLAIDFATRMLHMTMNLRTSAQNATWHLRCNASIGRRNVPS